MLKGYKKFSLANIFFSSPAANGSSQARDWIWSLAVTYAKAVTMQDPLTHCAWKDRNCISTATWAASVRSLMHHATVGTPGQLISKLK